MPRLPLLFSLTSLSLFLTISILILSIINSLGADSFYSVPGVCGYTIVYNLSILIVEHRKRKRERLEGDYSTLSTIAGIALCGIGVVLWLGCLTVLVLGVVLRVEKSTRPSRTQLWVALAQCILVSLEAGVLVCIFVRSWFERGFGRNRGFFDIHTL